MKMTEAERMTSNFNAASRPQGGKTADQAEHSDRVHSLERKIRLGELDHDALIQMIRAGQVAPGEAKAAWKYVKQGKTPLERGFKDLTADQALRVWQVATPEERSRIRVELIRKARTVQREYVGERKEELMQRIREAMHPNALPRVRPLDAQELRSTSY